jgi:beta-glucuronidase
MMLRPQDNIAREARRLDGLWSFRIDAEGVGRDHRWWAAPLTDARLVPVPASFNDVLVDRDVHDHVGDVWYQRGVFVPAGWDGRRIALRFDAACHRATVWFDDEQVAEHEGGYTPFEADVTDLARPGHEHRVTVAVNNELTWQSVPPGIVSRRADGRKQVQYYFDFFNYGGLHRSTWLCATPPARIDDVTVVTERDGTTGVVRCAIERAGETEASIRVELRDEAGELVAEGTGSSPELRVDDAHLWQPGAAYLYDLRVDLVDGDELVDRYSLPVGIRTVLVDGTRFLINDEPFYFKGFGMHEDLPVRGKGHDPASMVHDFALLGWLGANSFRTSHYPYAEEVLDHADRLGLVVIDETAAVGLNLGVGGGFFVGGDRVTFSEDTVNDATQATHLQAIRELIARDKNHPSVVLWSLANEPESHSPESKDYFAPLFALARELDPTRPVGFVNMLLAPPDRCVVTELADVVMINRYYGWYLGFDLDEAAKGLEEELRAWVDKHGKPIIVTEYGADAVAGIRSVEANPWSEEYQADLLDTYHQVFDRIDAVVGEHVWNFADFATQPTFMRVDGNKKGVFTRDRRPKAAAHRLRARWRGSA